VVKNDIGQRESHSLNNDHPHFVTKYDYNYPLSITFFSAILFLMDIISSLYLCESRFYFVQLPVITISRSYSEKCEILNL